MSVASLRLGGIRVWTGAFAVAPAAAARPAAREIDELGYDTLRCSEGLGTRESFANGAVLLAATERIRIASGIANVWGRDAVAAANAARALTDAWDGRFLLGFGVSHPWQVDPRGHRYESTSTPAPRRLRSRPSRTTIRSDTRRYAASPGCCSRNGCRSRKRSKRDAY